MILIIEILLAGLLLYVGFSAAYNVFLACSYFLIRERQDKPSVKRKRFAILVPAHNEELLIEKQLKELLAFDYPEKDRKIFVIADNCTDRTVEICSRLPVTVLERNDAQRRGKGYALKWAFEKVGLDGFDAVLVLDADTTADRRILHELSAMLDSGEEAIQCFIKIPNVDESWFTRIIDVSRLVNNLLYHHAKYKLGLSSYLMGSGMCFSAALLKRKPWTAFSLSEDWEYFAMLLDCGVRVGFCRKAVVNQMESRSLSQATTQRLRWSKGRFHVVRTLGFGLLAKGIRQGNLVMADSSLALLLPNWSMQINLSGLALVWAYLMPASTFSSVAFAAAAAAVGAQCLIFAMGAYLDGNYLSIMRAMVVAPVFLAWKFAIDLLCITGLYKGTNWIRTKRHIPQARGAQK